MGLFPAKHYPPHPGTIFTLIFFCFGHSQANAFCYLILNFSAVKVPSLLPHPGHHTLNVLRATTNWAFRSRGAFTRWAVTGLIGGPYIAAIV